VVESVQWLDANEVRHRHCRSRNIYAGQRVRYLLDNLLTGPLQPRQWNVGSEAGPVLKLTFDRGKAPVLAQLDRRDPVISVLPEGL